MALPRRGLRKSRSDDKSKGVERRVPLLGESRLLSTLTQAARASKADRTLIACQRQGRTALRFAASRVHQNFHSETVDVWVKVACSGHIGVATTSAVSPDALRRAVEAAIAMAHVGAPRRGAVFSAAPPLKPIPRPATYIRQTIEQPIAETLKTIQRQWQRTEQLGFSLAGSFVVGEDELAVVGSEGLACYHPSTIAGIKAVASRDESSGYAAAAARDIRELDLPAVTERAIELAQANRHLRDLPLGRTDCLLEPEAVAELLEWLGYIAFGAKTLFERTSPLAGRLGDRIMGESVSIADDALDPQGLVVPFDYEGIPKRRVALIERGVATGVVYDSHYGKLYNCPSTGHAMPYDETEGPLPTHLTLAAGNTPRAAMEQMLGEGLVVTRFHYVNGLLDTRQALMTGLTRDGTFLVKRGKIVGAVKNLRFTQSILEAFSRVAALSRQRRLVADPSSDAGSVLAPTMLVRGFTFTGKTQ